MEFIRPLTSPLSQWLRRLTKQPFIAPGVTVADSGIHGKGLFASKDFRKGAIIGRCATATPGEHGLYTLTLDDDAAVDVVCDLKYINHSPNPNAIYYDDLTVVALRRIRRGEEITHNYGDEWVA